MNYRAFQQVPTLAHLSILAAWFGAATGRRTRCQKMGPGHFGANSEPNPNVKPSRASDLQYAPKIKDHLSLMALWAKSTAPIDRAEHHFHAQTTSPVGATLRFSAIPSVSLDRHSYLKLPHFARGRVGPKKRSREEIS